MLSKAEKLALLTEYVEHYQQVASHDPSALNRKVPRGAFASVLDQMGSLVVRESSKLAQTQGPLHDFLKANPLPPRMAKLLPKEIRGFCLALNAIKQWVVAEQAAMDRYLLGSSARLLCREAVKTCLVTGDLLENDAELHHPVRDGRPPIHLSKRGHASIEGQVSRISDDPIARVLEPLKKAKHQSWAGLRRGCLELLGRSGAAASPRRAASDRTFARKACEATQLSRSDLLAWLNTRG